MSQDQIAYFFENAPYFESLWQDLNRARSSIYIDVYKIVADEIGERLCEILINKARAGVRVKIAVDGIGSHGLDENFIKKLTEAGIEWRWFHPLGLIFPLHDYLNTRDHRKLIVIDAEVGYIGSANLVLNNWRDTQARVLGPMVAKMEYQIKRVLKEPVQRNKKMDRFTNVCDIVATRNILGRNYIRRYIHRYMRRSTKFIAITTAYFVPDVLTIFLMLRAIRRGVTVTVITNDSAHCDVPTVSRVNRPIIKFLLKRGVSVRYYVGRMLHAKTIIIDGSVATMGSSNVNYRSFFRDLEANMFVRRKKWISPLVAQFDADLVNSRAVTPLDLQVPWYRRIVDALLYLIRHYF